MNKDKLNKPRHSLIQNGIYALEGLIEVTKNETSFKWQLLMFSVLGIVAWALPISIMSLFTLVKW